MSNKVKVGYNEKLSWLMHRHYIMKDFNHCKNLADQVNSFSKNNSEYAEYMRGMLKRVDGQVQSSLKHFQAAVAIKPSNINNIKHVAKTFELTCMYKEALTTYEQVEELYPEDWKVHHQKAACYFNMNDLNNAKIHVRKAMNVNGSAETLTLATMIMEKEGNSESAYDMYEEVLKLSSDNPDLLCKLAQLCLKKGDKSNAFNHASKCVALSKNHIGGMLVLGSILQAEGSDEVALNKYKALYSHHLESAALWNNISMCYFAKNKHIATMSCLKRASHFNFFELEILYNCALVYASMQLYASAFQYASLALSLKHKTPEVLMLLAVVMTKLQDTKSAQKAFEKSIELNGTDSLSLINYGIFLFKIGEISQAREALLSCKQHLNRNKNAVSIEIESMADTLEKLLAHSY